MLTRHQSQFRNQAVPNPPLRNLTAEGKGQVPPLGGNGTDSIRPPHGSQADRNLGAHVRWNLDRSKNPRHQA